MMRDYKDARIVLFAKLPRLGNVKTRLQPELSAEQALNIYTQLFEHSLCTLRAARLCPFEVWFDAEPEPALMLRIKRHGDPVEIFLQQGADLGQRMQHAAQAALQRANKIVLIGADCPAIDKAYLATALEKLSRSVPVVLGPADDGGYVMLAMQKASLPIFDAIAWGSDRVMQQTRRRLRSAGIDWFELPPLTDIDTPEDLASARRYGITLD